MISKHLFSSSTSKNLKNILLGSQQISTLWMNRPLAATTTRKKCLPLIWYFINSELRFDLLMTPHFKQLDVGQVIQVFARRRIFLCQVGLATPPQKITTVISNHFSGLLHVPSFQFDAMLSWALINKDESPHGSPIKIFLRKWKFQIQILFNCGVDFFPLALNP